MHKKTLRVKVFLMLGIMFVLTSSLALTANKASSIIPEDVKLNYPKNFPEPIYRFNKNIFTTAGFMLGRKLFYDPILSKNNTISCSSCHKRPSAFTNATEVIAHGINGAVGNRNVPPLQNLIWQKTYMWDGKINNLEEQPFSPITNPVEMNESIDEVIKKLKGNKKYVSMFTSVFGDTLITPQRLSKALIQFIGLMITDNSKYDKYLRSEDTLSKSELKGLNLFRANCASCHKEPLFTDNGFRNNGLQYDAKYMDSGRARVTKLKRDFMKFKVPSLRNVAATSPYMHDGRFKTLEQVLDHYTKDLRDVSGIDPLLTKRIVLSDGEKADIINFLKTLTDYTFLSDSRFDGWMRQ